MPQSPITPVSKRLCDAVFEFPTMTDEQNLSEIEENTFELPVASDQIDVPGINIHNKPGRPLKTPVPSRNPRGRKSEEQSSGKKTPLIPTAGTSNLRLLPKVTNIFKMFLISPNLFS